MEKIITEIQKNSMEKIKIQLNKFKGKQIIDVRSWIMDNPTKQDELKPTKKGISLQPGEQLESVIQGLQEAKAILQKEKTG